MSNQSFKNSYIKIGKSSKDPKLRKRDLYTTGVPKEFKLEYYALVENYHRVERAVHNKYQENRIENNREFFDTKIDYVVNFIRSFCADTLLWETPFKSNAEVLKELKERKKEKEREKLLKQKIELQKINKLNFKNKLNELEMQYKKLVIEKVSTASFFFVPENKNLLYFHRVIYCLFIPFLFIFSEFLHIYTIGYLFSTFLLTNTIMLIFFITKRDNESEIFELKYLEKINYFKNKIVIQGKWEQRFDYLINKSINSFSNIINRRMQLVNKKFRFYSKIHFIFNCICFLILVGDFFISTNYK